MIPAIHPYTLPDQALIDPEAASDACMVWQPAETVIVLGQSNQAETAVHVELAHQDKIPILKRHSGGQTVILSSKMLVVSVRLISERLENPQVYFKRINQAILTALANLGIEDLREKGISDIAIGEKKIMGSSIYRKKRMVFYHSVLNIAEPPEFIGRYLKHPTREPDYRGGRAHEDFVTSIQREGYPLPVKSVQEALLATLSLIF